jgi:hypothetical protein
MRAQRNAGNVAVEGLPEPAAVHVEATRHFWETRLEKELAREDARQIVENITGFFRLLAQWDATTPGA